MSWSVLQSASHTAASSSTASVTLGSNCTSGSTLIATVCATNSLGNATTSVKDGAGNSFVKIVNIPEASASGDLSLWALNTPAGDAGTTPTITATNGATCFHLAILVQEVSGIVTSSTSAGFTDGAAGTSTANLTPTSGATVGPPAYSTSAAGEYLAYVFGELDGAAWTWTAPGGYTADPNSINSTTTGDLAVAYKNSTGGTETGSWTIAPNSNLDQYALILVAFKLAPAAHTATASLTVSPQFAASRARGRFRTGHLTVAPQLAVGALHTQKTPQGSWWGLDTVFKQSRQEYESFVSRPPMACPNCGEPLSYAPATKAGSGVERYCRYDGWQYPRDWTPPTRPMPW